MKSMTKKKIVVSIVLSVATCGFAQHNSIYHKGWIDLNKNGKMDLYENPQAAINERIEDLLKQMTLEEKTCQMVTLYGYKRILMDELPTDEWSQKLWKDGIGAIDEHLNGFQQWGMPPSKNQYVWPASRHAWALNEVQRFFIEKTRLGIPVDFTNEGIRGVESYKATNFPTQLGLGHTWNRELVYKIGEITGKEARLLGYTNIYAPILDVGRDQRWGRYEEVYGESPYLVAELGINMVKGLQKNYQVAATAKHYVAYSNNKGAREGLSRVDPQMSRREVENIHVYPFKRVIQEAGLLGVMSSYNDYDGIPIQGSFYWLTTRLRDEFGFQGYVVSDSDAVEYLYMKHGTASGMKEAVRQSVEAGLNVRCTFRSPDSFVLPLRELVKEGRIRETVIDNRVRDILRVKFMLGLFDRPYQEHPELADECVNSNQHQKWALQASRESLVLLKNQNSLLPLDISRIKRIAVCGPNADEKSYALSHYGPLAVDVTTVLQGIKDKVGKKIEVVYSQGCDLVDANWPESEIIDYPLTAEEQKTINEAVQNVEMSDVGIVVLGGGVRTCGENKSRSSLDLPGRQLHLLKALVNTGKPIVLILINGRPLSINWADKFVPAILEAWYPGAQGGIAVADVLFGDYNPGGKLTVTFPKSVGQIPFNFPAKPASQVDGGTPKGVTGNMTRVNGALYPFGYGLSYTTFKYSDIRLSSSEISAKEPVKVWCKVKNTGEYAGDEVVQLYLRDVLSSITTYEKMLRGFKRIHLKPGEICEVEFVLYPRDLQLLNEDYNWVVEPGVFNVMIGASSEDIRLKASFKVLDDPSKQATVQDCIEGDNTDSNTSAIRLITDGDFTTAWKALQGDYVTIAIKDEMYSNKIGIAWKEGSDNSTFEIQVSSGGGQFLTVITDKVRANNKMYYYTIDHRPISDIRVLVSKGNASLSELKLE